MEKCDCNNTEYPFVCPRYNHKMYEKSHDVCKGKYPELYIQYRHGWTMAGQKKAIQKRKKYGYRWSYGVTTVPSRKDDLLPRTLASLKLAGFDEPWLFVDGCSYDAVKIYKEQFPDLAGITIRSPQVKAYGNWIMALWEIYIRNPDANYFALFQDDLVAYKNLRIYLESLTYPINGYWNLLTFPQNHNKAPKDLTGFFQSNQKGLGAVALVFDWKMMTTILHSENMVNKPKGNKNRATRTIDGAVVTAINKAGLLEFVHNPSLVEHIGDKSAIGNSLHPKTRCFKGEDFDARDWVEKPKKTPQNANTGRETDNLGLYPQESEGGLGDNLAKALKMVGITEDRVSKWIGRKCCCGERRQKLNQLGAWTKRVIMGKKDRAKEHLENIIQD